MLHADFALKLARVLTEYSIPVQPGDYVVIEASTAAMPLVGALYAAVLRCGGKPDVMLRMPELTEMLFALGNDEQIAFCAPTNMAYIEHADIMYYVFSEINTRARANVDAAKLGLRQQGWADWYAAYHRRDGDESLHWNVCPWPTAGYAQEAEMSLYSYTEFIYRACGLDQDDPVAYWRAFHDRQQRLVDWLAGKEHVAVKGPHIDVTFSIAGRTWENADGRVNLPDGEIFTAPVEDSVNGHVAFSYPAVYSGRRAEGVQLTFENGVVTEATAAKGEDYLLKMLDTDEGARRLGEFAIGTNEFVQQFTGNTLFDEKIGGTIHMAVGSAYAKVGGTNESAVHWDMVHDMRDGSTITVDGELFYENGAFVVG